MLQRTRARQVQVVFEEFARRFPSAKRLALASTYELEDLFRPLGLAWRVQNLVALCGQLAKMDGRVPTGITELGQLPGVGPYTAAAYLSLHAGVREPIVDSNVVRVLSRLSGQPYGPETRRAPWLLALADDLTPAVKHREYGYAVLDLGIGVCKPARPACDECPLVDLCAYAAAYQPSNRLMASAGRLATRHGVSASASSQ